MDNTQYPKATNSLLSQEEKNFLDDLPQQGVEYLLNAPLDPDMTMSWVPNDLSTSIYYEFKGERAQAVRDYYEMLFAYGVRKDPRVA